MPKDARILSLSHPVRLGVIAKYGGQLMLMFSALSLVPLSVSLMTGEYQVALRYGGVITLLALTGYLMGRLPAPKHIHTNEALTISGLAFLLSPLAAALPLSSSGLGFMDSFFEAVSAITTTGLSVAGTLEGKGSSFIFARAWMQWVGGLGIVVLSVALLVTPGMAARRLGFSETEMDDIAGGIRANARKVTAVYAVLTVAGLSALILMGTHPFDAAVHVLAGVSTGGFSSFDKSLGGLSTYTEQAVVIAISTFGAVSLVLYVRAARKGIRELSSDVELRALAAGGAIFTCAYFLSLWRLDGLGFYDALSTAPIMALSAQTTAGFSNIDVSGTGDASKFILIVSMAIGGSAGSTAGGIKLLRVLVLFRLLAMTVTRTSLPPHAVTDIRVKGQAVAPDEIHDTLLVILLFFLVCSISWLVFLAYGYGALDSLFDIVSATGTVGLSAGVVGPGLPALLKGVLCVDMIMGRVEFIALLVVLYPRNWIGKRGESI